MTKDSPPKTNSRRDIQEPPLDAFKTQTDRRRRLCRPSELWWGPNTISNGQAGRQAASQSVYFCCRNVHSQLILFDFRFRFFATTSATQSCALDSTWCLVPGMSLEHNIALSGWLVGWAESITHRYIEIILCKRVDE